MNPTRQLMQVIDRTDRRWGLLPGGRSVLVAFSGGADSTALLEALCLMRRRRALRIGVAHLDHRLCRSSAGWALHCRDVARDLEVPYHQASVDVRGRLESAGGSLEQVARQLRYEFLVRTAREQGYERIATAHTADDQAETFLMRLFRGAGPSGLGGIPVRRPIDGDLVLVRPLLDVRRQLILDFLKERRRRYLADPSNRDTMIFRNKVRLKILPYLSRQLGPCVYTRLVEAAKSCESLSAALEDHAGRGSSATTPAEAGKRGIALADYRALSDAYRMNALRAYIRTRLGHLRRITSAHLSALDRLASTGRVGSCVDLPGARAQVREGELVLVKTATSGQGSIDTGAGRGYNLALNDQGGEYACPKSKSDRMNRSKRRSSVLRRRSNAKASSKS